MEEEKEIAEEYKKAIQQDGDNKDAIDLNDMSSRHNKLLDDDLITKHFRGKLRRIITYQGSDGKSRAIEKVIDSFAAILIRVVGYKDAFNAWEDQMISVIDEYTEDTSTDSSLVAYKSSKGAQVQAL